MSESLFSRLFHYRESEKLSPRENYLTEMLAWMIDSLPQFVSLIKSLRLITCLKFPPKHKLA